VPLGSAFYARSTTLVARELLGKVLERRRAGKVLAATITVAASMQAGAFKPDAVGESGDFTALPAFCRVEATARPTSRPQRSIVSADACSGDVESRGRRVGRAH